MWTCIFPVRAESPNHKHKLEACTGPKLKSRCCALKPLKVSSYIAAIPSLMVITYVTYPTPTTVLHATSVLC